MGLLVVQSTADKVPLCQDNFDIIHILIISFNSDLTAHIRFLVRSLKVNMVTPIKRIITMLLNNHYKCM